MTGAHAGVNAPPIRIYDLVAQGSSRDGLDIAHGRHIDLSLAELVELGRVLGLDGLHVFCLYLEHLTHVEGPEGQVVLGVPEYSARWVQQCSEETVAQRGGVALGRNAAARGHNAVDAAGLLRAIPNAGRPGQGARGRSFRAVLNPRLVLIPGSGDLDIDDVPQVIRGRIAGQGSPLPRIPGKRETGVQSPLPRKAGKRETGPDSRIPGFRGSGPSDTASAQVRAGFDRDGSHEDPARTSSEFVGVVQELLSREGHNGLLRSVLAPALRTDRELVVGRLYQLFQDPNVAERAESLMGPLGLASTTTSRPRELATFLADTILGVRDPVADLTRLNVKGPFDLDPDELSERLAVGVLLGLGMRISTWGGWLHNVTHGRISLKPNAMLERFTAELRRLDRSLESRRARESALASAEPTAGDESSDTSRESLGDKPADAGHIPDRMVEPAAADPDEPPMLSEEVVAEHFAAARKAIPFMCRPGTWQADDEQARSRLVRIYLSQRELADTGSAEDSSTG